MTLESALVGAEDYKLENNNKGQSGVTEMWAYHVSVAIFAWG